MQLFATFALTFAAGVGRLPKAGFGGWKVGRCSTLLPLVSGRVARRHEVGDGHVFQQEKKMRHPYLLRVAFIALVYALAAPAFASATSPSNLFPDPFGIY